MGITSSNEKDLEIIRLKQEVKSLHKKIDSYTKKYIMLYSESRAVAKRVERLEEYENDKEPGS